MKSTIMILVALAASSALADEYVNGYIRKDGTYVPPHYQTERNDTKLDNYSTKGNTNPYTGKEGYVNPYAQPQRQQQQQQPQTYGSTCGYTSTGQYVCR